MNTTLRAVFLLLLSHPCAFAQWEALPSGTSADLRGLCVVSPRIVWVSGTLGTYARTSDGGKSWMPATVPGALKLDFRDVEAFGETTAYLLSAGTGELSRIYKTTDGGKSWQLQFQARDPEAFFDGLAFWDEKHGIALGDPVKGHFQLLVTEDGGANWKPGATGMLPPALPGEGAFAASGTSIVTHGEKEVWFVTGGARTARLFHSRDRGHSWEVGDLPIVAGTDSAGAFSLAFRDRQHAMIVGGDYKKPEANRATAALTTDGARTWKVIDNQLPYRSAVAWARDRWVAIGPAGSHVSTDHGVTWKLLDRENYNSVAFLTSGEGWAVGPRGRVARFVRE